MTESISPLPDLFPYLMPTGVDVPDGTLYAVKGLSADAIVFTTPTEPWTDNSRWTIHPIPIPRVEPPTDKHTVLLDVTYRGKCWDLGIYAPVVESDQLPWRLVMATGYNTQFAATEDLVSWTVADIVPRTAQLGERSDCQALSPSGLVCTLDDDHTQRHVASVGSGLPAAIWDVNDTPDAPKVEPDPLDESDHSPRIGNTGIRWVWKTETLKSFPGHHWGPVGPSLGTHLLAEIAGVTFADEVS